MDDVTTQGGLNPQKIWRALRNRKLYLVVPILLTTAVAAVYIHRLPPRYRAQSLVAAEPILPADFLSARPDAAPRSPPPASCRGAPFPSPRPAAANRPEPSRPSR